MGFTRTMVTAAVTVLVGAALHCGGKVDARDLPECPGNGTCSSACKITVTSQCGDTYASECECANGKVVCAPTGAPLNDCIADDCLGTVGSGTSCTTSGVRCRATVQTRCGGPGVGQMCTCNGSTFSCDPPPPDCEPPPTPLTCPSPDTIKQGGLCTGGQVCPRTPQLDCNGTHVKSTCICPQGPNARWVCDEIGCAQDAGSPK